MRRARLEDQHIGRQPLELIDAAIRRDRWGSRNALMPIPLLKRWR